MMMTFEDYKAKVEFLENQLLQQKDTEVNIIELGERVINMKTKIRNSNEILQKANRDIVNSKKIIETQEVILKTFHEQRDILFYEVAGEVVYLSDQIQKSKEVSKK